MQIALPDMISNSYFPAIAAVDLGFLKAEGYDAQVENLYPVPKTMEALRDGNIDFAAASAHATLTVFKDWKGAKLIAALAQRMYWLLILRKDLGVKHGDVNAVKGLRIAAAPGVDLGLRRLLAEAGIDPQRDKIEIGPVPGATGSNIPFGVSAAKALEDKKIDGFWANAMGAELAVRKGLGTMVLDVRRGDGPPNAIHYTFPAMLTSDRVIEKDPDAVAAVVRAIVKAQRALKEDPNRATEVGRKRFPPAETELIATLIERDLPYYDPTISEEVVVKMNSFAKDIGLLSGPVPYEQVVATRFRHLWTE